MGKRVILLFLCFITSFVLLAQVKSDSNMYVKGGKQKKMSHADLAKEHSPKKAAILSLCLPGAGQVYNKKYFKAPLIFAAFGTALYASQWQRDKYNHYKAEYKLMVDTNQTSIYEGIRSEAYIKDARDYHKKWMEISYIAMGLIYALQILDANVDAHLMSFDVGDDLSMQVLPNTWRTRHSPHQAFGLTMKLHFNKRP